MAREFGKVKLKVKFISVTGKIIKLMEWVLTLGQMGTGMMEIGYNARKKEKALIFSKMETNILGIINKDIQVAKEFMSGLMEVYMKDISKMD